jgi:hypothetical protein
VPDEELAATAALATMYFALALDTANAHGEDDNRLANDSFRT